MKDHLIHEFYKKLLQKSVFSHLEEYLCWQSSKKGLSSKFAPISINLDLTTACNFRCDHCIDREIINIGRMLDFQYIKTLIKNWNKNGLKSVILIGGGEPILYPYFEEVVKFLKSLSLQVGIVSNGTDLKKIENICYLLNKKDWVRLSLDAGTNDVFQKIHRPQKKITLDEVMVGVKKMRQKNSNFQMGYSFLIIGDDKIVNSILLTNNVKEISLAATLAKEAGFTYLSLKPFISPEGFRETTISQKNLREIKQEIKKAKKIEDDNLKIIESINLNCFYDEELKTIMQVQPKICHAQFFRSVVIPTGIYSCSMWRGFDWSKIINTNQKITKEYYKQFNQNQKNIISNFNVQEICKEINCLYAPFNCWVEDLINSPEKIKTLKPIDDFNDYFL